MLNNDKLATMDVNLLFSIVNMKLRNEFSSTRSLCRFYQLNEDTLQQTLHQGGFHYIPEINQYRLS